MLWNYLTIAFRNFKRRTSFTLINAFGLAIGLAACMMVPLYVHDELERDAFHVNADRIYRVLREFDLPDLRATIEATPNALAPALADVLGVTPRTLAFR